MRKYTAVILLVFILLGACTRFDLPFNPNNPCIECRKKAVFSDSGFEEALKQQMHFGLQCEICEEHLDRVQYLSLKTQLENYADLEQLRNLRSLTVYDAEGLDFLIYAVYDRYGGSSIIFGDEYFYSEHYKIYEYPVKGLESYSLHTNSFALDNIKIGLLIYY